MKFTVIDIESARQRVRQHYRLKRPVTDREVRAEIRSLLRQQQVGIGHDDKDELLWAMLSVYVSTAPRRGAPTSA